MKQLPASPFIIRFEGCWLKGSLLLLVMEYVDGCSAFDFMRACKEGFPERAISVIMKSTLMGLRHLHENRILHRDIKSGNILLSKQGEVKLVDFGIAAQLDSQEQRKKTMIGSTYWMAPEVIAQSDTSPGYDAKADIWSLGITAIELNDTQPPFYDLAPSLAIFQIIQGSPKVKNVRNVSVTFIDFIQRCLCRNPILRPSASDLLTHPFIKSVQDDDVQALSHLIGENSHFVHRYRATHSQIDSVDALTESTMGDISDEADSSLSRSDFLRPGQTLRLNAVTMSAEISSNEQSEWSDMETSTSSREPSFDDGFSTESSTGDSSDDVRFNSGRFLPARAISFPTDRRTKRG